MDELISYIEPKKVFMDELISYIEQKYEHSSYLSFAHKTGSMHEIYHIGYRIAF